MTDHALRRGLAVAQIRLQTSRNRFRLSRRRHPFRVLAKVGIIASGFLAFTAFLSYGISNSFALTLSSDEQTAILASFLTLFMIGASVGTSTAALQGLYLAEDVPFLMALPLPLRVIFGSKMLDASAGALPASILALGALIGFTINAWPSLWLIVFVPLVFVSTVMLTTALSVALVSGITRFIPPKRARVYLLLIACVLVGLSVVTWPLVAPHRDSTGNESAGLTFARSVIGFSPPGWSARAMQSVAHGEMGCALLWMTLSLGASALVGLASYQAFKRVYLGSLDRAIEAPRTAIRSRETNWSSALARPIREPLRAVAIKEWLTVLRDPRRLSGVIWPTLMVLVYTVVLGRRSGSSGLDPELRFWIANGSIALLPWGISLGLSVYAFGGEGRMISLIRTLPLSARQLFAAKTLSSIIPIGLISVVVTAATLALRGSTLAQIAEMTALVVWMTIGFVTIDTAASAIAPNFEIQQIQRAISLPGRAFGVATGAGFGLATVLGIGRLLFFAHGTPDGLKSFMDSGASPIFGWPLVVFGFGLAAGVVALAALVGVRRVEAMLLEV